jgi:hypothetical protein
MNIGRDMFARRDNNIILRQILSLCSALEIDSDEIIDTFNTKRLKVKLKKLEKQAQKQGLDIDYY